YLHVTQNLDGGFPEHKPAADGDTNSNPLSDGLVIQALVSLGQDPGREWTSLLGRTPLDNLLSFQNASGGFHYAAGDPPPLAEGSTTAPLPMALALRPLPILPPDSPPRRHPGRPHLPAAARPHRSAASGVTTHRGGPPQPGGASVNIAAAAAPTASAHAAPTAPAASTVAAPPAVGVPPGTPAAPIGGVQGISARRLTGPPGPAAAAWPGYLLTGAGALALLVLIGITLRRRTTS
ncbi:MAG: hypothetical protein ABR541_03960, partial [Candidatus Dormibacteria bacterium]